VNDLYSIGNQFANILNGQCKINQGVCSVNLHRPFTVLVQGRQSRSVVPVGITFESLDPNGVALNMAEVTLLQEEVPAFVHSVAKQGLIVSALHNHWIFTEPTVLYLHVQSVEPPIDFARKIAYSFSTLKYYPISEK
jgi:hypothetical protein